MSLTKKEVRAKGILPEAHVRLAAHAISHDKTIDAVVSHIINAHYLGADYRERLAQERLECLGKFGKDWD